MSVANNQDCISNDVESFHAALLRRVSFSSQPIHISKTFGRGDPGHSRRLGQADTRMSDTTFEEDNRAERQAYQNLRRHIYIGHVHSLRIFCLQSDIRGQYYQHSSMTPDDDSSETYDVEEVMGVATINDTRPTHCHEGQRQQQGLAQGGRQPETDGAKCC